MQRHRHTLLRATALLCLLAVIIAGAAVPANAELLLGGTHVRYKTPRVVKHFYGEREEGSPWVKGTLLEMTLGHISVKPDDGRAMTTVPRDSVFRLEYRDGVRTYKTIFSLLGGIGGAVAGVAIAVANDVPPSCSSGGSGWTTCVDADIVYGLTGFLIGFTTGLILGQLLEFDNWVRVSGWDQTFSRDRPPGGAPELTVRLW
jgi:hypothetical protein